jgi:hypothetical protein
MIKEIRPQFPGDGLILGQTGRLTVGRKVTLTCDSVWHSASASGGTACLHRSPD